MVETDLPKPPSIMEIPKEEVSPQPLPPPPPPIEEQKERTRSNFIKRSWVFLMGGFLFFGIVGGILFLMAERSKDREESLTQPSPAQIVKITEPSLPYRLSSAFIPLPPSRNPGDLTINWQSYQSDSLPLFFKYPKEWIVKKIESQDKIVRLSYPTSGSDLGSFAAEERVFVLVSRLKKEAPDLESQVARDYNFQRQEFVDIEKTQALKIYNVSGGTNIFLFIPHGEEIVLFEHHVTNPQELPLYEDVFLMLDKSVNFRS